MPKRPRDALARGNLVERAVDFDDQLSLVGARAGIRETVVARVGGEVDEGPHATEAQLANAAPHGDRREPTFHLANVVATTEASHGHCKDVLDDVLYFGGAPEDARSECADVSCVTLVEGIEAHLGRERLGRVRVGRSPELALRRRRAVDDAKCGTRSRVHAMIVLFLDAAVMSTLTLI
jgi:hypothetical protein